MPVRPEDKLRALFPEAAERAEARRILEEYGDGKAEAERVRLAILKLAGGDLAELRRVTDAALLDYRDVLGWAEFPETMRRGAGGSDPEVAERDRAQFLRWLEGDGD